MSGQWNGPVIQKLDPPNSNLSHYTKTGVAVDHSKNLTTPIDQFSSHNQGEIKSSLYSAVNSPRKPGKPNSNPVEQNDVL